MILLYRFCIGLYGILVQIGSLVYKKAKYFWEGRKNFEGLINEIKQIPYPRIWFHFPSLGEFEQGRPVLEGMLRQFPEHKLLITFFSPSGLEAQKKYPLATKICYLPLDNPRKSRIFVEAVNPDLAIFTKYDFWHFYFKELTIRNIPILIISAIFRPNQIYFSPFGSFFKKILKNVSWFFVQNEESQKLLQGIGISQISLTGDTRFDRVLEISKTPKPLGFFYPFIEGHKIFVAGSTWPRDEILIRKLLDNPIMQGWKCILVPHEVGSIHLNQIDQVFMGISVRYTECLYGKDARPARVMVVDTIGLLSSLYSLSTVAYIGNGFGSGIHNTLEGAIYGKPLIFGPNFQKFKEARDLLSRKAAFSFKNEKQLISIMENLVNPKILEKAGYGARQYCLENLGATAQIIEKIRSDFMP